MAKRASIKITGLGDAITQELTLYHEGVVKRVNNISKASVQQLAKKTQATAPVGARGDFKRSISSKLLKKRKTGDTYVWYVKPPNHRLTHLLVKGHETRDGERTNPDPFLANALAEVLPEYEAAVERTLKNG